MRTIVRASALLLAAALLLGLTVSCDEGTEMRFDQAQYAAAAGDPVQLKFIAEERKSQGCMLIEAERSLIDQTQHVEAWKVEPAGGASVTADGTFTATEPGEYTVTATSLVNERSSPSVCGWSCNSCCELRNHRNACRSAR